MYTSNITVYRSGRGDIVSHGNGAAYTVLLHSTKCAYFIQEEHDVNQLSDALEWSNNAVEAYLQDLNDYLEDNDGVAASEYARLVGGDA